MHFYWYGHSCFLLTSETGLRILTDPFAPKAGYPLGGIGADVVTISHDHFDHNYIEAVSGNPLVIRDAGPHTHANARITGIPSYHDDTGGSLRGNNLIFLIEADDLRIAHLGDLGSMPSDEALRQLGNLDVLLAPVGGVYTIAAQQARDIANMTHTNVLIPMHYQTSNLTLEKRLDGLDTLLNTASGCRIHRLNQSDCDITRESLGDDRLLVLDAEMSRPQQTDGEES